MRGQQTWSTPVREEKKARIPCAICAGTRFRPSIKCEGFSYVKCTRCGLVQINPQPETSAVHNRYGEDYLNYERANEDNFFELGKLALSDAGLDDIEADIRPHTNKMLEVGCATGAVLAYMRERGWDVKGVEISRPQAEYARKERGLDITTLPLEENRFAASSFGMVSASHLIEHLNDPAGFVREVRRILVPGGVFIVTTPNIAGLQARIFGPRWRSAIFDHLYLFSTHTLRKLLRKEGFRIAKIVTWGGIAKGFAPPGLKKIADRAAKRFAFGDVMLMRCESVSS